MDKDDVELGEIQGATEEINCLIDFVNGGQVTEKRLRDYISERITVNQKKAEAQSKILKAKKASLEAKTD